MLIIGKTTIKFDGFMPFFQNLDWNMIRFFYSFSVTVQSKSFHWLHVDQFDEVLEDYPVFGCAVTAVHKGLEMPKFLKW